MQAGKAQFQSWLLKEERLSQGKKKIDWPEATDLGDATRARRKLHNTNVIKLWVRLPVQLVT